MSKDNIELTPEEASINEKPVLDAVDTEGFYAPTDYGSDLGAIEAIYQALTKNNPKLILDKNNIKLEVVDDIGKIETTTGRGGWHRRVTYRATYNGEPIRNCTVVAQEGIPDDSKIKKYGQWFVEQKDFVKEQK
ncbi:hypothetical protein A3H10_01675 [Candidatus Uhrbacteria bacterium RIFCSPLOWO2_12_FULL_46_10]|uniref:Uncharacterized protein n=1 Tax=Candidatus Uhrbacteria bacterium RIFCSPLOWO2_01_FULL_47_25 TaxID=1802402 RepID=A0A1F7UWS7_9BACT|nr:MAG: hypothetical protein UX68_C0021G0004 [Parcubacteria group bacterium GW2011_GWA2_46_9]OGL60820.1 MAG: hypothetical protein A2752_00200 [Candidatus Uhrbacteria bacterium RIFCSPHIGHO2_01_FULL_46_23]OGL69767.1 MAG: hypothetical protein A3D60_01370 [Candidatus Uhrbacteria bacterium RIFCSPHIGHO2_02_FULL_47_29]OGL75375.1 MAG: hypothetical protein A3E96_04480 [Candidatus Uhrbacteria bacterium RIFCSPHIGHO2_12_FULL_46_13]OGL82752.1 MAG: hypothetical protein A2936_04380 [Candidatus Uhrbacteria bac